MQNKGAIRLFAILLSLACIYYLSFTWVTNKVENEAKEYAAKYVADNQVSDSLKEEVTQKKEDEYLDSMKSVTVFDLFITEYNYAQCKQREINLGLDLRGGMNVTLEVSIPEIIKGMANNTTDQNFNKALAMAKEAQKTDDRKFVTLFGEAFKKLDPNARLAPHFQTIELRDKINFNSTDEEILSLLETTVDDAIRTSEKTLRARIDKFGVTQPNIQFLETSGRILVELPGVKDKERVRKLLQGTANLEFWETHENSDIYPKLTEANKRLAEIIHPVDTASKTVVDTLAAATDTSTATIATTDSTKADTATKSLFDQLSKKEDSTGATTAAVAGEDTSYTNYVKKNPLFAVLRPAIYQDQQQQWNIRPGPVVGYSNIKDTAKVNEYLSNKKIQALFPPRTKFVWGFKPFDEKGAALELVALNVTSRDGKSRLSGDIITDAMKQFDSQGGSGNPQISMTMTPEAGQIWKQMTKEAASQNPKRSIAIVLDNSVYSYPTVQTEIAGGRSQITGNFTVEEADDLINVLKAGKLPAPARIVEETVVGPTLGAESIRSGILSFAIALIVVLLYMAVYYSKAGVVADIALFANVFFVMGVLASMGAVLTLPGIAGIVLTIGMSVDANILIFERVREEIALGKGASLAIKEGYSRAMSSILDSNATTFLLGIILYIFGTGPIQGFATTLCVGILTSLFSAIFITRLIFDRILSKNKPIPVSIKLTENVLKNTNINFVAKRKYYYIFSGAVIIAGLVSITIQGFNLGVDFKGGRSYVVRFDETKGTDEVRNVLAASFDGHAPEVKTYGENNQQRITTSYLIDDASEDAEQKVEAKLKEGLDKTNSGYEVLSSLKVGETVSRDIRSKAIFAILFGCLVMFIYINIRFKKWQYGLGSVVALLHDAFFILAAYSLLYKYLPFNLEIDQHFIAAILTVMGYSMNDTVVVYDRIREYLSGSKPNLNKAEKSTIINNALNGTLSRTINTSLTIFFVLAAIFIFGGETIRGFSFALLIGIIIGTYSSICIATPIVIDLEKEKKTE